MGRLQAANGNLFVAGNGQICVFTIATLAKLDSIGTDEFDGFELNGLDFNRNTNTLWTTSTGFLFSENAAEQAPDGLELIAKVELDTGAITLQGNFTGDMARLFPNGIIVDQTNSAFPLHFINPMECIGIGNTLEDAIYSRHYRYDMVLEKQVEKKK
jgi:hypothetical protein